MNSVRFVADGMLGTLARKLRMFGFDTLYYNSIDDKKLISIGKNEERIILTCDKALFQRATNTAVRSVLLESSDDVHNMAHVLKMNGILDVKFLPERSRCPLCNSVLDIRDKTSVRTLIPQKVVAMHEKFYFCKQCCKVYWQGSHLRKLEEFGLHVMRRLDNAA